jgi:uncharacterized protein (TIGR02996 family)
MTVTPRRFNVQPFIEAILADPTNPSARLAMTDWLEEQGLTQDQAEVLRQNGWWVAWHGDLQWWGDWPERGLSRWVNVSSLAKTPRCESRRRTCLRAYLVNQGGRWLCGRCIQDGGRRR